MSTVDKSNKPKGVSLREDAFVVIDDQARYQIKNGKIFIEIELPNELSDIMVAKNLSGSGKTFRVYTNSTNRKFIKNEGMQNIQLQINGYLSVKDASETHELDKETLALIALRTAKK